MLLCCLSQWLSVLLPLLFAILPWASSRSVWSSLPSLETSIFTSVNNDKDVERPSAMTETTGSIDKRSGSDPWGICPHSMIRIDCFYRYLSIYAQLRDDMEESSPRTYRNIGKRTKTEFVSFAQGPASRNYDDAPMDSPSFQDKDGRLKRMSYYPKAATVNCPSEWALLKCLINGYDFNESLKK